MYAGSRYPGKIRNLFLTYKNEMFHNETMIRDDPFAC